MLPAEKVEKLESESERLFLNKSDQPAEKVN